MKRPFPFLLACVLSACSTQIQHGLDERDANEIVTALMARGFEAKKTAEKGKKQTWAIELDDAEASAAMQVLHELKLPRAARLKTQTLAQNVGLIDTPAAERLRQLEAQEGDLEESLETMDGVTSAAVELVVPPSPRPGQAAVPSKASVLIRAHPGAIERLQMEKAELRALVAGGVDGLLPDDVVLVIDPVVLPTPTPQPDVNAGLRPVVFVLGLALSIVAIFLVLVTWKLKASKSAVSSGTAPVSISPSVLPRPTLSAQRKVAT